MLFEASQGLFTVPKSLVEELGIWRHEMNFNAFAWIYRFHLRFHNCARRRTLNMHLPTHASSVASLHRPPPKDLKAEGLARRRVSGILLGLIALQTIELVLFITFLSLKICPDPVFHARPSREKAEGPQFRCFNCFSASTPKLTSCLCHRWRVTRLSSLVRLRGRIFLPFGVLSELWATVWGATAYVPSARQWAPVEVL